MGHQHSQRDPLMRDIKRFADRHDGTIPIARNDNDIETLREENEQLRALVIQLSRIVARNVIDRK